MIPGPVSVEVTAGGFVTAVRERFEQAVDACIETRHHFRIAETRVRLRFAGPAMVSQIVPALAHLRAEDGAPPDLEVCIWDSASTGVPMIPPPCESADFTRRGNLWGVEGTRFPLAFHYGDHSVNAMDRVARTAVYWVRDSREVPFWVRASPLRSILHWWMEQNGKQLIHAAAVGTEAGGVLLPGRGGTGKSSTALACLLAGLRYVGDDYVAVELDPRPRVHSLYSTAKLGVSDLQRVPRIADLAEMSTGPEMEKAVMFLGARFADQLVTCLPLVRLLVPRVTGEEQSRLGPIDPLDVERAVSGETLGHLPLVGRHTVNTLIRLSREVPRAALHLGTRREWIPDMVAESLRLPSEGHAPDGIARPWEARVGQEFPLISVVIRAWDPHQSLAESLGAVLDQDYPRVEIIVVDGVPTPERRRAVEALVGPACYCELAGSVAIAEARNRGIREAAGEFVAFLDAGDRWPPDTLRRLAADLSAAPELAGLLGLGRRLGPGEARGGDRAGDLHGGTIRPVSAGLFRRTAFRQIGLFRPWPAPDQGTEWFWRAERAGLGIRRIDDVTIEMQAGRGNAAGAVLRTLKESLDRHRRGGTPAPGFAPSDEPADRDGASTASEPPLVSVIMAVKNGARFLASAIDSVLAQDYRRFEIVVVDGGSEDDSVTIAQSYARVRVVPQRGVGVADAYNTGIDAARGTLLAFLSCDDRWTPDKLSVQVDYLRRRPEIGYVTAYARFFLEPGCAIPPGFKPNLLAGEHPAHIMETLLARRSVVDHVGGFDPALSTAEDVDWFSRAHDRSIATATVPRALLHKRVHDRNLSLEAAINNPNLLRVVRRAMERKRGAT